MAIKSKSKKSATNDPLDNGVKEVKAEWHHFIKFSDENRILFSAFIILLCGIAVVNTIYIVSRYNKSNFNQTVVLQPTSPTVVTSLQTASTGALRAKISNVTENSKPDYAFTISPDDTMLTMDISITNTSQNTQKLLPSNQLYVRSDEGDYSALHPSMYVTNVLSSADIKPGQTASGTISFDLPKRVARPLLYIDTGWGGYTPPVIDVLH